MAYIDLCKHCGGSIYSHDSCTEPRANDTYRARRCKHCNAIIEIAKSSAVQSSPDDYLTALQADRLLFAKWRYDRQSSTTLNPPASPA